MYNISSDIFFILESEMQIKQNLNVFERPSSNRQTRHLASVSHHASVIHAVSDGFLKKNWCFILFFFLSIDCLYMKVLCTY